MVDNRSAGFYGIGGSFNFRGGDISGTAAKMSDDKMGQGSEYFAQGEGDDDQNQNEEQYVDRSAQLRATLNSLAMMNVASVLNSKKRTNFFDDLEKENKKDENFERLEENDEEFLDDFEEDEENEQKNEYY